MSFSGKGQMPMLGLIARVQLWQQVALSLKAGLTVEKALAQAAATPGPGASIARRLLATGEPALADATDRCAEVIPAIEAAVVRAGEMSGKLPESLRALVERLRLRRERLARLVLRLAYPVLIIHVCALVATISRGAAGPSTGGFWLALALALAPFYAFVAALFVVPGVLARLGPDAARLVDACMLRIPFVGRSMRQEAEAELLWLLGTLLDAGIGLREAMGFAAAHASNRAFRAALEPVAAAVTRGEPLGDHLMAMPYMSAHVVSRIATAEIGGSMPEVLLLLAEESRTMNAMGRAGLDGALVALFMLVMAAYAMWAILGFWLGYFGPLMKL